MTEKRQYKIEGKAFAKIKAVSEKTDTRIEKLTNELLEAKQEFWKEVSKALPEIDTEKNVYNFNDKFEDLGFYIVTDIGPKDDGLFGALKKIFE
jgi:hypothetical protein